MVIKDIGYRIIDGVDALGTQMSDTVFGAPIRLGVTGLARSGKTVFITSLIANLLSGAKLSQFAASAQDRIELAYLKPQPNDTIARFDYETHLAQLCAGPPTWPENTKGISTLRLTLKLRPTGLLSGLRGAVEQHIDIVDYPGEWLLDLGLMDKTYEEWSTDVLHRMANRSFGAYYVNALTDLNPSDPFTDAAAKSLAACFTDYLENARMAGYSDLSPGRFLLPGDMAGSPALTFAPVPKPTGSIRKTFWAEMKRRYDAYKTHVVRPFFRDHFSKIDRQIVLVDLLSALDNGPDALSDLQRTMGDVVRAFRPGQNSFLTRLVSGQRVDKILFAATKADHLHHTQHGNYTNIMRAVMDDALRHAKFRGAQTAALSLASVRSTTEALHEDHPCVRGSLLSNRKNTLSYAGSLPENAQQLLRDISDGRSNWLGAEFTSTPFAPPVDAFHPDRGIAHIRLDQSLEFLLGDRL